MTGTELSSLVWLVATQFVVYAVGWGLCSLVLSEQRAAVAHWAVFMLLLGAGFLLTTLRSEPRQWWAYGGANLCFAGGFVLLARGVERFMGVDGRDTEHLATLATFGALFTAFGLDESRSYERVVLAYASCVWVLVRAIWVLQLPVRAEYGQRMALVLAIPVLAVVVVFGQRALQQALQPGLSFEMHRYTDANRSMLYFYIVAAAMYNFGFVALLTLRYLRRLRTLTLHDPLTGLLNRRALDTELQREWLRLQRSGEGFAIAALDLDHFKRVNDRFGHLVGDEVLAQTAVRLQQAVRGSDVLARTGGEEFVVLMPGLDDTSAQAAGERLRAAISGAPLSVSAGLLPITVSVGVATVPDAAIEPRDALLRADRALYRAKEAGRDRVVMAG